jgi:hypothetical protein
VGRAKGSSGNDLPFRVIPARGQITDDSIQSEAKQSATVLHDDVSGSNLANDPVVFGPQPASLAVDPGPLPGVADVLAREPAADEVGTLGEHVGAQGADVIVPPDVRPVLRQNLPAERVDLHLPDARHARAFKPEVESADASE